MATYEGNSKTMDASSLTAFDIGVLAIVGLSTLLAFGKGFANVALSLAAWVGAFAAVIFGNTFVQPYAQDLITPPWLANTITIIALFFVTLLILKTVGGMIGDAIKSGPVGFLDRSLGALFGLVRGMVIISLLYFGFTTVFPDKQVDWVENAKTKPLVAWGAEMLEGFAQEALGRDPTEVGEEYLQQAASAVQSQFIEEHLAKQAAEYATKDRAALENLIMQQAGSNPELQKYLNDPQVRGKLMDRLQQELQKQAQKPD
jgi:membrane protein required for colicin V production